MSKSAIVCLFLLATAIAPDAAATVGGPNSFAVLGVDPKSSKLFLRESVGGESGDSRLWTFDLKAPLAAPVITYLDGPEKTPEGLEKPTPLGFAEVKLTGTIVSQSLEPRLDALLHRFDLKVELSWATARRTVALVAYRNASVQLVDAHGLPGGRCALAFVSTLGKPEEGGYLLQVPVLLCADKPLGPVPVRKAPTAPTGPTRPPRTP